MPLQKTADMVHICISYGTISVVYYSALKILRTQHILPPSLLFYLMTCYLLLQVPSLHSCPQDMRW